MTREFDKDQWNFGSAKDVIVDNFWTWDKSDRIDSDGEPISGADLCKTFEKELWFELGKCMWRKHQSTFQ